MNKPLSIKLWQVSRPTIMCLVEVSCATYYFSDQTSHPEQPRNYLKDHSNMLKSTQNISAVTQQCLSNPKRLLKPPTTPMQHAKNNSEHVINPSNHNNSNYLETELLSVTDRAKDFNMNLKKIHLHLETRISVNSHLATTKGPQ